MEIKFSEEEVTILRLVLSKVSVKSRTGELGVMHAERFVSAQNLILKKEDKNTLDKVIKKIGLSGLNSFDG